MSSANEKANARLEVALAVALGAGWDPAPPESGRQSIFLTEATSGSWVMAMPDPRGGVIALVASRAGEAPRQTIHTPDLTLHADLYDWLATDDLSTSASDMAAALRTLLEAR
ncbi:hypothetical protein ABZT23_32160 [Streptomyces sp. NPDC005386]|uniref:hypothetical protein n=1 Tax=Streptomyces sp. NPDC005386 TaxID=3154562 RepID=UPI0033B650E7